MHLLVTCYVIIFVRDDRYSDTGYNLHSYIPEETDTRSTAIGKTVYCVSADEGEDTLLYADAVSSGLMRVKTSKSGKGSITSTRYYVPGSIAKVKVKAGKKYRIQKIRIAGKTYKYSKKTRTRTVTASSAIVKNVDVRAFFKRR